MKSEEIPEVPVKAPPIIAPVVPETVITYEQNPDLPTVGTYTTADEEGNIEIPETGRIDFLFPSKVGETELNSISAEAFMDCGYFRTVTIPKNIASIGDNAFANCENLKCIILEGRSDTEGMELGSNWAGEAEVIFELVAIEQPKEKETPPVEVPGDTLTDLPENSNESPDSSTETPDDAENADKTPDSPTEMPDTTGPSDVTDGDASNDKTTDTDEPDENVPVESDKETGDDSSTEDVADDKREETSDTDDAVSPDDSEMKREEDADLPKETDSAVEGQDDSVDS